jgi:hypothetical protein
MWSAHQLYALVEGYARLGDHRTGTAVDQATLTWLTGELTSLGAEVVHDLYAFDRYDATASVLVDGRPVECLPLPYCATGAVHDRDPGRAVLVPTSESALDGLPEARALAAAEGRGALVVATAPEHGGLFALNQHPSAQSGLPVLLVADEHAPALRDGAPVEVHVDARVEPGFTSNLLATWGGAPEAPYLLVTTPLTGWFGCAGERGTGLALAMDLAATLAADWPVLLLGCTGHELGHLGARHHLAQGLPAPAAVLHLGASAAAVGTRSGLASEHVRVTVDGVDPALPRTGHAVHEASVVGWRGEAQQWSAFGVPTVSIAGASPLFHTPQDLLPAATTPALLAQVRDGLLPAASALAAQALLEAPAGAVRR